MDHDNPCMAALLPTNHIHLLASAALFRAATSHLKRLATEQAPTSLAATQRCFAGTYLPRALQSPEEARPDAVECVVPGVSS